MGVLRPPTALDRAQGGELRLTAAEGGVAYGHDSPFPGIAGGFSGPMEVIRAGSFPLAGGNEADEGFSPAKAGASAEVLGEGLPHIVYGPSIT